MLAEMVKVSMEQSLRHLQRRASFAWCCLLQVTPTVPVLQMEVEEIAEITRSLEMPVQASIGPSDWCKRSYT
jgi:hypothetical protein